MLAKKPKQPNVSMYDPKDTILDSYGATPTVYTFDNLSGGVDTITLDSSLYNTSITNASTISWNQNYTSGYGLSNTANVNINTDGISIKEGGDIKIAGKSLSAAIEAIEERLGILNPNPELEERWDQLKELRKQYVELEKDLIEKEKLMKILKEK